MTPSITGEWLIASETRVVLDALSAQGATPRFVGGCVRDALIGRTVRDIDIAVDIPPDETMTALERAGLRVIPTGLSHGTVTAVSGTRSFEITSLRQDKSTDGRHAVVTFTKDWSLDAARRDFTMNALYAEDDGTVVDVLGTGLADLNARRVRFIGSASARIQEDYLRILRLFLFHAWYGKGDMEPDALVACAGLAGGIAKLSRERVGAEMLKLLAAPHPEVAVDMMAQTGVLSKTLPFAEGIPPMAALVAAEGRIGISPDPIRRMALLIGDADPVAAGRGLRLSNEQLKALRARGPLDLPITDAASARRAGYERGEAAARDRMLIQCAQSGEPLNTRFVSLIMDGAASTFPVAARDLIALGLEPGPEIGEALDRIERDWIESDFTLDRATLLSGITGRKRA